MYHPGSLAQSFALGCLLQGIFAESVILMIMELIYKLLRIIRALEYGDLLGIVLAILALIILLRRRRKK